jgi:chromate reductase, NAD(P)H dehydrogenase (quinone)
MKRYRLLAISGSLRTASTNTMLLHAAAMLLPAEIEYELYSGIGDLPHFNPDREDEPIPEVIELRDRVRAANGLLICSPEYARGVPGSLKNALDWLVGGIEIVGKPVALLNASPYSVHAQEALTLILGTMSARVIRKASITLPLRGRKITAHEIVAATDLATPFRAALEALIRAMTGDGVHSAS